jgi:hypothetical protein
VLWIRIRTILVTWTCIRIKYKSGFRSALNKNQDPDPHQNDKLDPESDPDPHQFADDKSKYLEYEPICALSRV